MPDYFAAEKAAYMAAVEDEEACLLLEKVDEHDLSGEEEHGPIEPFLEAGVAHFTLACYSSSLSALNSGISQKRF